MNTIKIKGTGSALPEKIMTNKMLEELIDTSDEWISERTGIRQRHISAGETVVTLAAKACERALENAGKTADQVDLILLATCSPESLIPCAACQVQDIIGADKAVAFDLNAACAGFLFGLNTAYAYISSGCYKNALIVGSEVLSKIVDWSDRSTCILFGDGAGAVYVEAADEGGLLGFVQHANGKKGMTLTCGTYDLLNPYYQADQLSKYVWMDGREIFQFAVRQVPACVNEVLEKTQISVEDIDLFVLHQANARIIESIAKRLGVSLDKFPINVDRTGNMSSATIPVLLDELNRQGKLREGMRLVLSGFGAGLTYGACVLKW